MFYRARLTCRINHLNLLSYISSISEYNINTYCSYCSRSITTVPCKSSAVPRQILRGGYPLSTVQSNHFPLISLFPIHTESCSSLSPHRTQCPYSLTLPNPRATCICSSFSDDTSLQTFWKRSRIPISSLTVTISTSMVPRGQENRTYWRPLSAILSGTRNGSYMFQIAVASS